MKETTLYFNHAGVLEFMYLPHKDTDLYLSHCGMQQCSPSHTYGYKARPEYHLHFVLDGFGTYEIEGRRYTLSRGHVFVVPPGVSNYVYYADAAKPWYYAWVAFNGRMAAQYMAQAGFDRSHLVRSAHIPPEEFTGIIYEMLKISQLSIGNELDRTGSLFLIMSRLIESVNRDTALGEYEYSSDTYIKHALQYMKFNYNRNIKVQDIVNYVGINRSYFSTLFKEKMKLSPKEWLQNFRMAKARELLSSTALPIAEIAVKVGYCDLFTFSKLFKRLNGVSPSQYRKSIL